MTEGISVKLTDTDWALPGTLPQVQAMTRNGDGTVTPALSNISNVFRDSCELFDPENWETPIIPAGDFIAVRGNSVGAGWLAYVRRPGTDDIDGILTLTHRFKTNLRLTTMLTLSHRSAGHNALYQEFVSDDEFAGLSPNPDPVPVTILQASQATTVITVEFATPPAVPFRIGQVVSIDGFVDTRLNVKNASIASILSNKIVTLVGNDYAFTSTTIANTLGNAGGGDAFMRRVDVMGGARNGVAMVRGNASATNARFYVRAQAGYARPSGTAAGSHNATVGTDASTQLAGAAPFSESWGVPTETLLLITPESVTVADRAPDAGAGLSGRHRQSQIVPNPSRRYKLRFRIRTALSVTRPVAPIVSVSKTGTTTATVITAEPHGLISGQYVGGYGVRDQTNFANLTTAAPCTVVNANTYQVVWGAAVTATSYGGFAFIVQGQQALGGAVAQVAQSVARAGNILTLVGNAAWAAPIAIGNIVDLKGVRDNVNGADLGVDGAYVVRNIATTSLTLEPAYDKDGIAQAPVGADIPTTNCGGGVIQCFEVRIHAISSADYTPLMTEPAMKGLTDAGEAQTVAGLLGISSLPALPAGTNAIGSIVTGGQPPVPTTPYFVNSAASTNGALIITGTSAVQALHATNNSTTNVANVKLYNKATAPVVGTDVPEMVISIPVSVGEQMGEKSLPIGYIGHRFPLGLGIAITGGKADTDTAAVAAGQVKVKLARTA